MWVGVCLSVMVELIPERLRNTGVGLYFFIISNIGGNMPILLPPLEELFQKTSGMSELNALRGNSILNELLIFRIKLIFLQLCACRSSIYPLPRRLRDQLDSVLTHALLVQVRLLESEK